MGSLGELLVRGDALMRKSAGALGERFGLGREARAIGVYVPGRVEFLGRHTDYPGGRTIILAVDRGFRLAAVGREDNILRVVAAATPQDVQQFACGTTPAYEPGHWVNYVATVARRVAMNFADSVSLRGADMAFSSDLPIAAGMSSSSALMVATFLTISAVNGLDETEAYRREIHSRLELAAYLGCVENGQSFGSLAGEAGVGTFGGSEDHTAMLCCKPEMLSQFSYAPSVFERDIPFPLEMGLVLAASGVHAVKTGSAMEKFNRASIRASKATAAYNRAAGADCRHLREIAVRVGPDGLTEALEAIRRGTQPEDAELDLPGRFEQFFRADQEIVPAAGDALLKGDVAALGELFDASHAGAARGLQNQIEQTNFLQASARKLGAVAASGFGAGFGGSVLAIVEKRRCEQFRAKWQQSYAERFSEDAKRSDFFISRPGKPAEVMKD